MKGMGRDHERKKVLQDQVPLSEKDEYGYDDLIRDISELLLSGERIFRNPDSVGTSSGTLVTGLEERIGWFHRLLTTRSCITRRKSQRCTRTMFQRTLICFCKMVKNLRAHLILNGESSYLIPYRQYLESHGWSVCFNDTTGLCCLARLGVDGSIRQIGGPN